MNRFKILLILSVFILTGCEMWSYDYENRSYEGYHKIDTSDPETQQQRLNAYNEFIDFDFSQETIYLYENYHLVYDDDIHWLNDVLHQNYKVYQLLIQKYIDDQLEIDDTRITYENSQVSYLTLTYNDGINPEVIRELPVMYVDVTKDADDNPTNIIPKRYSFSHSYEDYTIDFSSYDNDFYMVTLIHTPDNTEEWNITTYSEPYTGPKAFFMDDIPIIKIWKDKMGYRADVLNQGETHQNTTNKTQYYVYSVDITTNRNSWFLDTISDAYLSTWLSNKVDDHVDYIKYDVDHILYDAHNNQFQAFIHIYNTDQSINTSQVFDISDETINYTEDYLDYRVEMTKISEELVNITYKHKLGIYTYSYTIPATPINETN